MKITVKKSRISGIVNAPPSKSVMQRVVAVAVANGKDLMIQNPSFSGDGAASLEIARQAGFTVVLEGGRVELAPRGKGSNEFNCGESGLCMRMFPPVLALSRTDIIIDGAESLRARPVAMIEGPLTELGVECITANGFPPVHMKGTLRAGRVEVDGSTSSQFLTGLLIALSSLEGESVVTVKNLKSRPYIDLTIEILKDFGFNVKRDGYERFHLSGGSKAFPEKYSVEGDWSGASFLLIAAAVAGKVEVTGLRRDSNQADSAVLEALEATGAKVLWNGDVLIVERDELRPFEFNAEHCPDLFPPLVALAASCPGRCVIKGAGRLTHKESDRASVLTEEFSKMGIDITREDDVLIINGAKIRGAKVDSHNDHRIAMACAVAGLNCEGSMVIYNAEAVNKSYPRFFKELVNVGGNIGE